MKAVLDESQVQLRIARMCNELAIATQAIDRTTLGGWALDSALLWPKGFIRRGVSLVGLASVLVEGAKSAAEEAIKAGQAGNFVEHVSAGVTDAWRSGVDLISNLGGAAWDFADEVKRDPAKAGTDLFVITLTALASGGGLDGDGGIPDWDIPLAGIGAHRSILSHSIIAGTTVEFLIGSLLGLVRVAHAKLPEHHDPIWDTANALATRLSASAMKGVSLGIGYHLFVDSLLQPGAYHGVPGHWPMWVHQSAQFLNAQAETADVTKKDDVVAGVGSRPMPSADPTHAQKPKSRDAGTPTPLLSPRETLQANLAGKSPDEQFLLLATTAFVVDRRVEPHLSLDALSLLRRTGSLLRALEQAIVAPVTEQQRQFVDFTRHKRLPTSEQERVWHTYRVTCANLHIQDI